MSVPMFRWPGSFFILFVSCRFIYFHRDMLCSFHYFALSIVFVARKTHLFIFILASPFFWKYMSIYIKHIFNIIYECKGGCCHFLFCLVIYLNKPSIGIAFNFFSFLFIQSPIITELELSILNFLLLFRDSLLVIRSRGTGMSKICTKSWLT